MNLYRCTIVHKGFHRPVRIYDRTLAISPEQARNQTLFRYARDEKGINKKDPYFRIKYNNFLKDYDCLCEPISGSVPPPKPEQLKLPFEQHYPTLLSSLLSENITDNNGLLLEWEAWIDSTGMALNAEDMDDHASQAFYSALGISPEEHSQEIEKYDLFPGEPISIEAAGWLQSIGTSIETINKLNGYKDPRDFALKELGWTRMADANFTVWELDDAKLKDILDTVYELYIETDQKTFNIEDLKTKKFYEIPVADIDKINTLSDLRLYG